MRDLGDRLEDSTIDFTFFSVNASGAPTTLAGTPAISVYKANGTTQSTAGVTLTADFDSVTGLNHVRIDTSADAFYATGNDYAAVITTGTVNSVSVVGATVGTFSIENRCASSKLDSIIKASTITLEAEVNAVTSQTSFTITGGPAHDLDEPFLVIGFDDSASDSPSFRMASSYAASGGTITLDSGFDFTLGTDDSVALLAVPSVSSDVNVTQINGTTLTGDGSSTPWGPA